MSTDGNAEWEKGIYQISNPANWIVVEQWSIFAPSGVAGVHPRMSMQRENDAFHNVFFINNCAAYIEEPTEPEGCFLAIPLS